MSADAERNAADTAKWAARWRELEREAIEIASEMADPEAKRHMLFVAENYRLLAERTELRGELLAAVDDVKRVADNRGKDADSADEAK